MPVMFPIYMVSGKLIQTSQRIIRRGGGHKLDLLLTLSLDIWPVKLTMLTVGASIACWTSTLV
jgi:hypothetical protein